MQPLSPRETSLKLFDTPSDSASPSSWPARRSSNVATSSHLLCIGDGFFFVTQVLLSIVRLRPAAAPIRIRALVTSRYRRRAVHSYPCQFFSHCRRPLRPLLIYRRAVRFAYRSLAPDASPSNTASCPMSSCFLSEAHLCRLCTRMIIDSPTMSAAPTT